MQTNEEETHEPLDPVMERVRRKMVRLMIVSTSIMVIGLGAVIVGIFYRASQIGTDEVEPIAMVDLDVEAEALIDATLTGDRLVLTIGGDAPRVEVRRLADGALLQTFRLKRAP